MRRAGWRPGQPRSASGLADEASAVTSATWRRPAGGYCDGEAGAGCAGRATWAQDQGESTAFDSGTPAVGDAIVFYQPGVSSAVGSTADHVGLIVGVDSSKGTVDIVNGDFMGSSNITCRTPVTSASSPGPTRSAGWKGPAPINGTARAGSGIAQSDDGQTVVFINPAGQVVNDWGNSTGWHGPALIGGTSR